MRILIIVNEFPPDRVAGTALSTFHLAKHLTRRGHEVRVLVTERIKAPAEDILEGFQVRRLQRSAPKGLGWLLRLWFVWREAKKFQPDILQGQAVSCGLLAAVCGRLLGVPSITYAQGQDVYQAKPWQRLTEIRWGCLWPTAVLAVSNHLAGKIRDICRRKDIRVLPHGFEPPSHFPEGPFSKNELTKQVKRDKSAPIVLNVGRLEAIKGQDILLSAWPSVLASRPEARLWLVGNGSKKEDLKKQADLLGITATVRFWGYLPQDRTAALLTEADLFVLPSRSEAFGIVLLEAMARGIPVVASNVKGVAEVVPPSGEAYLVPPEDVSSLGDSIVLGLSDFKKPAVANRLWAMSFTWERIVLRFENVYEALCR